MRRIFTLLMLAAAFVSWPILAQEIDESYVFMDEEGNIIENGATVIRNVVEPDEQGGEVIYSGISVLNQGGSSADYLKMHYTVERIDNGTYQICFPSTCNMKTEPGNYETGMGQLMSDLQDIQSEWFPDADGECIVELTIEIFTRQGMFPPTYVHKAFGPTLTLRFVKGDVPGPGVYGDVTGDGEVNINDINFIISRILDNYPDRIAADVNGDGEVNILDVNEVINVIIG